MEVNHKKSKLKRKGLSAEKQRKETCPRNKERSPERPVLPAEPWPSRDLSSVEMLWASLLRSAPPHLQDQSVDLLPELPRPSKARTTPQMADDQRWCDLREEVAPLPEPAPPSPECPGLSPQREVNSLPTTHVIGAQLLALSDATPPRVLAGGRCSTLASREEVASSSSAGSAVCIKRRTAGERDRKAGLVKRQRLTSQVAQRRQEEQVENEEELVSLEGDGGGGGRGGGGGGGGGGRGGGGRGGRLQCCPMCTLVFPAGFTETESDGHLAQCLSEMNVSVTW